MEVILRTHVPKLGKPGDVVRVKDGYARNYLIPKGFAIPANRKNLAAMERERQIILAKAERERKKHMSLAEKIEALTLTIPQRVIEEDRLYGSVSAQDIVAALEKEGIEISRKQVLLDNPIKTLGEYEVGIRISPEVTANLKIKVVPLEE
ncbi:50S ribosomal protein L9 [Thermosulfurimonas dismutans]|uniref:Large ribosomal subunit protein bL9 n=1 Tax=Thermosulfurimonas dismutans TaxID=999894 RepID=A0A179D3D2_9BACT|nr:50S ribosomal protein L9 [Thermosulfurimonas dismutans]OAQ20556.1 LSU ribosomal protein L9p [Thermosulfurimonas dismutans]